MGWPRLATAWQTSFCVARGRRFTAARWRRFQRCSGELGAGSRPRLRVQQQQCNSAESCRRLHNAVLC
eukprot:4648607-Alexandrium_andersonii.AAC.1